MEYGPETPDPFPRRTSGHAHQHGKKGLARETRLRRMVDPSALKNMNRPLNLQF